MGAGWRWAKEGKMGIFIIVSTIKIRKKNKMSKKTNSYFTKIY